VAVLDAAAGTERVALVGTSASAMTVLRVAAEQPQRVTHLVIAGGFAESLVDTDALARLVQAEADQASDDWPGYIDTFMSNLFTEPHSTKPFEDGVGYAQGTSGRVIN